MFILVNDIPINIYSIKKITDIITINKDIYDQSIRLLGAFYGFTSGSPNWLATEVMKRKESGDPVDKPFIRVIDHISEVVRAIEGKEVYEECSWFGDTNLKYRFLDADNINWEIFPDSYFFGIIFDASMSGLDTDYILKNKDFTGDSVNDVCLYSRIYQNLSEITAVRNDLVNEIETIKSRIPKKNI